VLVFDLTQASKYARVHPPKSYGPGAITFRARRVIMKFNNGRGADPIKGGLPYHERRRIERELGVYLVETSTGRTCDGSCQHIILRDEREHYVASLISKGESFTPKELREAVIACWVKLLNKPYSDETLEAVRATRELIPDNIRSEPLATEDDVERLLEEGCAFVGVFVSDEGTHYIFIEANTPHGPVSAVRYG
jgi:hypothetical protein